MHKIFILFGLLFLSACSDINNIDSMSKAFLVDESGSNVQAHGRWKVVSEYRNYIIPKINAVTISCNKNSMICREHEGYLTTKKESKDVLARPLLHTHMSEYKITKWKNGLVEAKEETRAYDVYMRISLADKSIEKSYHETSARGASGANANNIQSWILV